MEVKNAKIKHAMLGFEGHGILTICITLDYGGAAQSFGGYSMGKNNEELGRWVLGILEAIGVSQWHELEGKYVRVKADTSHVYEIGHIVEERWFKAE